MEVGSSTSMNKMQVVGIVNNIHDNISSSAVTGTNGLSETGESDIKILMEKLQDNNKHKIPLVSGKKIKIKKPKMKGNSDLKRKRKLSGSVESHKKIKRRKKEDKQDDNNQKVNKSVEGVKENKMPTSLNMVKSSKNENLSAAESISADGGDAAENEDSCKHKPVSSRKVKAFTNACNEILNILLNFECDVLHSMDTSLRVLKEHNVFNNKLITMDTLMELIGLALDTNKASEEVVTEHAASISKIVSNLTSAVKVQSKGPRARQNILNSFACSPQAKSVQQVNVLVPKPVSNDSGNDNEVVVLKCIQTETLEEGETTAAESHEKPLDSSNVVDKSGKNCITNYFKKLNKTAEENERSNSVVAKIDVYGAVKFCELSDTRRQRLEEEMENQTCQVNYLVEKKPKQTAKIEDCQEKGVSEKISHDTTQPSESNPSNAEIRPIEPENESSLKSTANQPETQATLPRKKVALIRVDTPKPSSRPECGHRGLVVGKAKAKLFQFHDNRRPPYWGTWRRKSDAVGPRKPFGKDKMFNYEIDSDDEWEGEEEPGESLHGSDDEKEPEEDYEVDNDFFVPHGYLSDDENPEKENVPLKTKLNLLEEQFSSELNQKSRKMTPIVFGTYWAYKGLLPSEGGLYQDLNLDRLQYFPWATCPIEVEEDWDKANETFADTEPQSQAKKTRGKVTFPEKEVANLIKMIHGSPQNCDLLARKFIDQWQSENSPGTDLGRRSGLTKKCVLNKIRELATWQAVNQDKKKMCWQVPKETQIEFGAEVIEPEKPEKKPQKCYIWKFIKKGDKTTGLPSQVSDQEPDVVVLDS